MQRTIPNKDYFKPNIFIFEKNIFIIPIIIYYIIFACVAILLPQAGSTLAGVGGGTSGGVVPLKTGRQEVPGTKGVLMY